MQVCDRRVVRLADMKWFRLRSRGLVNGWQSEGATVFATDSFDMEFSADGSTWCRLDDTTPLLLTRPKGD